MKKIFLAVCILLSLTPAYSQNFTIPNDTVTRVVTTTDNLHNDITNVSSSTIQVTWNVVSHDLPADWAATFAICDNYMCYSAASNILSGISQTTASFASGATAVFYALPDVSAATPGTYYVQVRMVNGSQTKDSWYIMTKPGATAVVSYARFDGQVAVYPNPTSGNIKVLFSSDLNAKEITVFDIVGKIVRKHALSGNSADIDVSELPSGAYLLGIIGDGGQMLATTRFTNK